MRTSFSKTLNILKVELDSSVVDKGSILDSLSKIENLIKKIKILDDAIIDLIAEDDKYDEELISKELEDTEIYSDAFITVKRKINKTLNVNVPSNSTVVFNPLIDNSNSKFKRYKLPKLNIKPFDSKLINYLPFWSQFKKIHEDEDLDDCDKFQYLLQSVEIGTRARD